MSDLSARLGLPLLKPSQAQKHVTHNEALQLLDALVQAVVEETGAETPPFAPVDGQVFALGANPTGDWAGESGNLALRVVGAWLFLTPRAGWRVWDRASGVYKVHDGAGWVGITPDTLQNMAMDATNRLSVSSPAVLFNNEGAGHRLKINKAAAGDTASLLFQSGFTGHAEMGLAGVNDWSIKVSPDGTTWTEALVIDKTTGEPMFYVNHVINDRTRDRHRHHVSRRIRRRWRWRDECRCAKARRPGFDGFPAVQCRRHNDRESDGYRAGVGGVTVR